MTYLQHRNWRVLLMNAGILATFALIAIWYRIPPRFPLPLPDLYVTRFAIFYTILWTVFWWLLARLPGFQELRRDGLRRSWALALLVLAVWAWASQSWAFMRNQEPQVAASASLQFAAVALFALVVACAAPSVSAIVTVLAVGVLWNIVLTSLQVINQADIGLRFLGEFRFSLDQPGSSVLQAGDLRWVRPYGLLPHPNPLGGFLAIGLLAVLAWVVSDSQKRRWAGTLIFVFGLWSLLVTFSRGAWLGFAAGTFGVLPLLWRRRLCWRDARRHVALTLVLALAVGAIFVFAYRDLIFARTVLSDESGVELRSVSDRMVFLSFAYRAIGEYGLLGVGMGNFPWRTSYYLLWTDFDLLGDNVHHVLLSAWVELGLIGLLLLIAALVVGVEAALRAARHPALDTGEARQAALARALLFGGFLVLTAIGLVDHYPWTFPQFQVAWWGLLALAIRGERPQVQAEVNSADKENAVPE